MPHNREEENIIDPVVAFGFIIVLFIMIFGIARGIYRFATGYKPTAAEEKATRRMHQQMFREQAERNHQQFMDESNRAMETAQNMHQQSMDMHNLANHNHY